MQTYADPVEQLLLFRGETVTFLQGVTYSYSARFSIKVSCSISLFKPLVSPAEPSVSLFLCFTVYMSLCLLGSLSLCPLSYPLLSFSACQSNSLDSMEAFIEEFNHDHMKYKCEICCFGKAHVMVAVYHSSKFNLIQTAAGGVGIYKLGRSIGLLYDIVITVYQLRHGRLENIIELLLILTPVLLDVICLVFLFMAIKRLNRRFLLIFLIGTGLQTLLLTVLITILWVTLSETLTRSYNFFERDEVIGIVFLLHKLNQIF